MAGQSIPMSQLKQVLRLHLQGYPIKRIVRETGLSRNTIRGYLRNIKSVFPDMEDALNQDDFQMEYLLRSPVQKERACREDFLLRLEKLQKELSLPHMTKQLLWEEYKRDYPDGYQYSRFCYYLQLYNRKEQAVLVGTHHPGEKMFIDFTGNKLHYVDPLSGVIVSCDVYVATLGYSNYIFVKATHSQKTEEVIASTVTAVEDFGGSPRSIVPDNMKTAVTSPDRYTPVINEAFLDMANHYSMVVLPARVRKPRDKAKVERSVQIVYQRIFAALRKQTFYSLQELNDALKEQSRLLNERSMQQEECSRQVLLERDERPALQPLPKERYEMRHHLQLTLQANSHVYISRQKKYYSAPYQYIGNKVQVVITSSLVRIYFKGECIATHPANRSLKYNTQDQHLPSHHQFVRKGMNEQVLKERASVYGDAVLKVIEQVLASSHHPEQAFNSCLGIMALAKKTSAETLIKSCSIALDFGVCSFKHVQRIAFDQFANRNLPPSEINKTLPAHPNIRGAANYKH